MEAPNIAAVRPAPGLSLAITWKDGSSHTVDLSTLIGAYEGLAGLAGNPNLFGAVEPGDWGWCAHWTDEIEIAADTLWHLALEQDAAAFKAWRKAHRFTQAQAADALGLSLRTVKYYEKGEQPIPKTVKLACIGYDHHGEAA